MRIRVYLLTAGDALSQFGNAVLFDSGNANQSISGRAYIEQSHSKFWRRVYRGVNALFFWQHDHCRNAYDSDVKRAEQLLREAGKL